jgi:formylmethanofuran dehydrogenase subunit A
LVGVVAVNWILCQDTLYVFCARMHVQFQQLWNTLHSKVINCACYCNRSTHSHMDNNQIFFILTPTYFDQASSPSEFMHLKINH